MGMSYRVGKGWTQNDRVELSARHGLTETGRGIGGHGDARQSHPEVVRRGPRAKTQSIVAVPEGDHGQWCEAETRSASRQ
jgi:hypothetical protein